MAGEAVRFNEAAGADPADARISKMSSASQTCPWRSFNEAAGADPADAHTLLTLDQDKSREFAGFNEAAGADPADADTEAATDTDLLAFASMRPRGQTPRMLHGTPTMSTHDSPLQ